MQTFDSNRCIAFAAAVAVALAAASADAQTTAHVLRVIGSVEIATGEPPSWQVAQPGQSLPPGAAIRTGDGARAEVALDSGTVRVYENSLLRIPARRDAGANRVWLGDGAGIFDVKLGRGDRFEVETPEAVAAVKGTRFHVSVEGGRASFGVYEGVVELRSDQSDALAEPLLVRAGFSARSEHDTFELVELGREDPWDAWEAGAPAPGHSTDPTPAAPDLGVDAYEPDPLPARLEQTDEDVFDAERDVLDAASDPLETDSDRFEVDGDVLEGPALDPALDDAIAPIDVLDVGDGTRAGK